MQLVSVLGCRLAAPDHLNETDDLTGLDRDGEDKQAFQNYLGVAREGVSGALPAGSCEDPLRAPQAEPP